MQLPSRSVRSLHGAQPSSRWRKPHAFTWLTTTPQDIDPEDILSSLSNVPSTTVEDPTIVSGVDFATLLVVTPGFAHWIDPANSFLERLVDRLSFQHSVLRSIPFRYAVAAVVDKIPDPSGAGHEKLGAEDGAYEGLSLLMVEPHEVQWKAAPPRRIGGTAGEEPSLVVSLQSEVEKPSPRGAAHEIGLRLAHTVFTNGKDRTFLGMRFTANEGDPEHLSYSMDKLVDLSSCLVTTKSTSPTIRPTFPLDPVTPRRKVITSMGNILRQVAKSTDPNSLEPMPASQELEKELPRYIDEHEIVDHRVSVWALVEKSHFEVCDSESPQERVQRSLEQGGRLHRVMSGGGGWGKKQGLLSLDPEMSFPGVSYRDEPTLLDCVFDPTAEAPQDMPFPFEWEIAGDDLSHLSQVAAAGDLIQFFVSTPPSHTTVPALDSGLTYCFGIVSDADEPEAAPASNGHRKRLVTVPNTFGALSETAIAYSQPVGPTAAGLRSSTKLDIPGFRVVFLPENQ
ncbi:uncharacterized protein N7459_005501 [Penicillium hispanicum]|uniref:uncharacterized protein n=1 Tax=Penicillium hispanicum TaxID=1080232 RepID=UPI00254029B6|nr:uncharacterized protein N7459_005501 [Penicillium hispanicum]KAJ5579516.1 hypothetical protein N7459_005501 [Penicillium hispanicum]